MLEIEIADPWKTFNIEIDREVNSFYYLASLLNDSIRGYIESMIFRVFNCQKLISPHEYESVFSKIKFKNENGLYYASILKSILKYNPSEGDETDFSKIKWDWSQYVSKEDFIKVLREALTLWESTYKMIIELSSKSKVAYISTAFENANLVLKSKIAELKINELL